MNVREPAFREPLQLKKLCVEFREKLWRIEILRGERLIDMRRGSPSDQNRGYTGLMQRPRQRETDLALVNACSRRKHPSMVSVMRAGW